MKFVAIGRTEILLESVKKLIHEGHELVLMVTCPHEQYQYSITEEDYINFSSENNVECLLINDINSDEVIQKIASYKPDIAISYNWKTIIRKEVFDLFIHGVLNSHSGDIPRYKGNAARNWAIISGESEMALTIYQMTEELDFFKKKLLYRASYRGSKEMDILLGNFVEKNVDKFSSQQLRELEKFLRFEDETIFNFYNYDIVKDNIDKNEISSIFKKFKF